MNKSDVLIETSDIPRNYKIYHDRIEPEGIDDYQEEAIAFARASARWVELERERDKLKVIGCTKGLLGKKRRFLGNVPEHIAKEVLSPELWGVAIPTLSNFYAYKNGNFRVLFQIRAPEKSGQA